MDAYVLKALEDVGEASLDCVAGALILNSVRMSKSVSGLRKLGLIEETPSGMFRLAESLRRPLTEIIAVEMKLQNWRAALRQARAYTRFADRSYVVLDGGRVSRCREMVGEYRRAGVGLLFQWGWQLEPVLDAAVASADSPHRFIALQKLLIERPT